MPVSRDVAELAFAALVTAGWDPDMAIAMAASFYLTSEELVELYRMIRNIRTQDEPRGWSARDVFALADTAKFNVSGLGVEAL